MNLPNKLSLFRVCLVPVLVGVYLFPYDMTEIQVPTYEINDVTISLVSIISLFIFVVASFTDYLDGSIARKRNLITSFGKFVDPIADKLLVNTCFILLAIDGSVPLLAVIIMIWRDSIVDGIRMMASQKGKVMAAGIWGKLKTVLQMVAIVFCFLENIPFVFIGIPLDQILVWLACSVSVLSGITYYTQAKDILMESI